MMLTGEISSTRRKSCSGLSLTSIKWDRASSK